MVIPYGALVQYKPNNPDVADSLHKFAPRTRPGIFAGYHLHHGGKWSGDYLIYDLERLSQATDYHQVHIVRVKEVVKPEQFTFPVASGDVQLFLDCDQHERLNKYAMKKTRKKQRTDDTNEHNDAVTFR